MSFKEKIEEFKEWFKGLTNDEKREIWEVSKNMVLFPTVYWIFINIVKVK